MTEDAGGPLLGIDLGTSSVKAVVLDRGGRTLADARAGYPVRAERAGWAESDPADWWSAVVTAVNEATRAVPGPPAAVGLSGQMHGVVLADATGLPVRRALLWADGRATAELERYRRLPEPLLSRLANPLSPGMAGPLLAWVAEHEPAVWRGARWALQPKDWLRLRLTGRARSEPSDASATLLYDPVADRWDTEVAEALGIDARLLAPLVPSGAVAGELGAEAARLLGLPPGTPVAAGAADTAAAALGAGLTRPGQVQLTVGTGGQLVTPLDRPRAGSGTGTHLYRAATARGWYAMAAVLNAGLALEWVIGVLGAGWDELYAAAARQPSAADPLFLPYLTGERTPHLDPSLRGGWAGLALGHDRTALLRSALEGVAFALRDALDALDRTAGRSGSGRAGAGDTRGGSGPRDGTGVKDPVRLAGGGSIHPAWRQLLADVLDRPLHAVETPAASGRGAALLAGLAVGAFREGELGTVLAPAVHPVASPDPAVAAAEAERLARFRALTPASDAV
jgi:xylulokinase